MRQVLQELYDLLLEQKSILGDLLELAREERRIIISGEAGKLEEVVRSELRGLSKLGTLEKKRAGLNPEISAQLDIPGGDITISAIMQKTGPEERPAFKAIQAELVELIDRHTALNKENRELIEAHSEYTQSLLEMMVGSEDPLNNFYGGDGKSTPERKKTTGFFDGHA